jgi:hypothetical protein
MSQADKLLGKMRTHPRDWRIDDLKTVAHSQGIRFVRLVED